MKINVRKLGIGLLSLAVIAATGLIAWSATGGHAPASSISSNVLPLPPAAQGPKTAPKAAPTTSPSASPKATTSPTPAPTLNPAHKSTPGLPACGDTITKSMSLDGNIVNCPGNGLFVGADNITIDLNGYELAGTKADHSGGIRNDKGYKNVKIQNGTISGFDTGIVLGGKGAIHNTIDEMSVTGNRDGILLSSAGSNTVQNNTVDNNDGSGIKAASDSNAILGNDVSNERPGIEIDGSSNTVSENSIKGGGDGIAGSGNKNNINENDLRDGAGAGIVFLGNENTIASNSVKNFGSAGIWIQQVAAQATPTPSASTGTAVQKTSAPKAVHNDTVKDNDVSKNGHDGILVDADNSVVDSNGSSGNSGDGIATRGSSPIINDNDANNNMGHGIDASGGVRGSGNSAHGNKAGDCSPSALCD